MNVVLMTRDQSQLKTYMYFLVENESRNGQHCKNFNKRHDYLELLDRGQSQLKTYMYFLVENESRNGQHCKTLTSVTTTLICLIVANHN